MHERAWWNLYILVSNQANEMRTEVNKLVESLLPWLNLELWDEIKKKKKKGDFERENVAFEDQLQDMLGEDFTLDTLTSSGFDKEDGGGPSQGSIKDSFLD